MDKSYPINLILKKTVETYALLSNKRFYCNALNGDSYQNIAINSDMTVSCNCNDYHGQGKIGDLTKQSIKEIFTGKTANQFRSLLSQKKLPIINCATCTDLKVTSKNNTKYLYQPPRTVMIENTVNCNLNCLSCMRSKINSLRQNKTMSLDDVKLIARQIKENDIRYVRYFNLGEPFLSDNLNDEIKIIRKLNPDIYLAVSTNGLLLNSQEKKQAAMLFDEIHFSIHGSTNKSNQKYQKNGNFDKVYANMKNLINYRNSLNKNTPVIKWKYVLFRWNDSKKLISNAIKLAKQANIDEIFFEKTLSPISGISYKHYLNLGYLNRIGKFSGRIHTTKFNYNG